MAVLCGLPIYTRSYPHYPQEKHGNEEMFLWKPPRTDVLCRNHKNAKTLKKWENHLTFLMSKSFGQFYKMLQKRGGLWYNQYTILERKG